MSRTIGLWGFIASMGSRSSVETDLTLMASRIPIIHLELTD